MTDENKILSLTPAPEEEAVEPNALAIERAEQLLADTKTGYVQGFVVVGETSDNELFEGGASVFDLPLIYLGLDMAKARLLAAAEES